MRISTKGRYALRVMIDLAQNAGKGFLKLHDLSQKEQISEKYLEGILGMLVRAKILEGARGKDGGYKIKIDPSQCSIWDILKITEISVTPVACLDEEGTCDRISICKTRLIWTELNNIIQSYLKSIKLDQLLKAPEEILPENIKEEIVP